jgi:hypothetical protein
MSLIVIVITLAVVILAALPLEGFEFPFPHSEN